MTRAPGGAPAAGAVLLACLAAAGCAGFPGSEPASSTPPPPGIQDQLFKLQKDSARLLQQMDELEKALSEDRSLAACAEAASRAEALERQVKALEEQWLSTQRRLDEVLSEVRTLRPGATPVIVTPPADTGSAAAVADGTSPGAEAPPPGGTEVRPGPPTGTGSPSDLFNAAYSDYSRRHYELALVGFQAAYQADPRGPMADDALYWTGETLYAMGRYVDAIGTYDALIEAFPSGEKTPAAMLKKGLAQFEARDNAAAVGTLQGLIERFPNSDEARIAREHLRRRGIVPD